MSSAVSIGFQRSSGGRRGLGQEHIPLSIRSSRNGPPRAVLIPITQPRIPHRAGEAPADRQDQPVDQMEANPAVGQAFDLRRRVAGDPVGAVDLKSRDVLYDALNPANINALPFAGLLL